MGRYYRVPIFDANGVPGQPIGLRGQVRFFASPALPERRHADRRAYAQRSAASDVDLGPRPAAATCDDLDCNRSEIFGVSQFASTARVVMTQQNRCFVRVRPPPSLTDPAPQPSILLQA